MTEMLDKFMADPRAFDMYITGAAGTGKTTGLAECISFLKAADIKFVVCAYTHKACSVLRSKLPAGTPVTTLHSWLKKRPSINTNANNAKHVESNVKTGASKRVQLVIIDEYSQVGEKDLMDIRAEQDGDYDGAPEIKALWLGDPHQLPPVGDMESVRPGGKYSMTLTKVYRQAKGNKLLDTLHDIIKYIEGEPPKPLKPNANFVRGVDIVQGYLESKADKVLLAYTNKRVQLLNAQIQGYLDPREGDRLFSPTTRNFYTFKGWQESTNFIQLAFGNEQLHLNSKFKTLEYLLDHPNLGRIAIVEDEDGVEYPVAAIFGHQDYKLLNDHLKAEAAKANKAIETEFPGVKAAGWAKANNTHPLARARSQAWRNFLTFNECTICLDFPHAMTVHKSQGSTFEEVFVDMEDLGMCADRNLNLYLRLTYVALSRASKRAFTN